MQTIYQIIEDVASHGSTVIKRQILEANMKNEVLKKCFLYAENPRINFWIKADYPIEKAGTNDITESTFVQLDKLVNREYTGNAAREFVAGMLTQLTEDAQIILQRIINKDLRCGAGTSISNKVWKDLIPEYPVMLASKGDLKSMEYLKKFEGKEQFVVQRKCDGGRCLVKVDSDGSVSYHSRNGSALNLFGRFDDQFSKFSNSVFDGELLVTSKDGVEDRKTGNGYYTKAVRGTISEAEAKRFSIVIWDVVSTEEYFAGLGKVSYQNRYSFLKEQQFGDGVSVVESKFVNTLEECNEFYQVMRARGEEGAIIKVASSVWEDKRSKNMVKLKASETADLLCTGIEEGSGKYAGKIGNLICQTSCGKLVTGVGTGLKDSDREKDPSEYIGKIIEVVYNELITSKGKDTHSLFLPVFKQIRLDKSVANSLEELN